MRIFAKPVTRKNRRMGVALARGDDVDEARARAATIAGRVRIVYSPTGMGSAGSSGSDLATSSDAEIRATSGFSSIG